MITSLIEMLELQIFGHMKDWSSNVGDIIKIARPLLKQTLKTQKKKKNQKLYVKMLMSAVLKQFVTWLIYFFDLC